MLTDSRPDALDLLVVGGLTVDRFADGSSAPGGSVLHIARAAAHRHLRIGVITAAGPEAEAAAGLDEVARLTVQHEVASQSGTATFVHREQEGGRRLRLERDGGSVVLSASDRERFHTAAVLYAPVAGEIEADALRIWDESVPRGAILQGWLRASDAGGAVSNLTLAGLEESLREALGRLDLLVASSEDLRAEAATPDAQLTALRMAMGRTPVLVVTDGTDGLWIDHPGARPKKDRPWRAHLAAPVLVEGAPTVGAGDILAAFLMMGARVPQHRWRAHVVKAMRIVAEELESRLER
jgi:sugar/nucleoside kinase (ribokinase family)